jgi:hypothetical protein
MVMLLSNVVTLSSASTSVASSFIIVIEPEKEKSAEALFTRLANRPNLSQYPHKVSKYVIP